MATDTDALALLRKVDHEMRVITAEWLFLDVLGVIPVRARELLSNLADQGQITLERGGWLRVTPATTGGS